jgi:lysophospholipase L1-like esterase
MISNSETQIKSNHTLLFQGDSITDAGRDRLDFKPNSPPGLGSGYPAIICRKVLERFPDHHLQCYNRGISGDGIEDLHRRWKTDTLPLLPDWISILIGVNDCWRFCSGAGGSSPDDFHASFRRLLQITKNDLPLARIILCEPFLLPVGLVEPEWIADLVQRQQAVRSLAEEFEAALVPFQSTLDRAASQHPPGQLLEDGVHPTSLGHQLLADCWLASTLPEL